MKLLVKNKERLTLALGACTDHFFWWVILSCGAPVIFYNINVDALQNWWDLSLGGSLNYKKLILIFKWRRKKFNYCFIIYPFRQQMWVPIQQRNILFRARIQSLLVEDKENCSYRFLGLHRLQVWKCRDHFCHMVEHINYIISIAIIMKEQIVHERKFSVRLLIN